MTVFARTFIEDRIWCAPTQDLQALYQPAKRSGMNGVLRHIRILHREIPLPDKVHRYHVFQIGALPSPYMGLNTLPLETWVSFEDLCNVHQCFVEGYTLHGIQLPKAYCYLRKLRDNNVIIAVERLDTKLSPWMDLNVLPFHMRFYTNAWLLQQPTLSLYCRGRYLESPSDIINLQNEYYLLAGEYPGQVTGFANGIRVSPFTMATLAVGMYAEIVVDPAIRRKDRLPIAELETFLSTVDGTQKYILHHDHADTGVIEYKDDLDVYLTRTEGGKTWGVYLHQNRRNSLRMLTHRDYSIAVSDVTAYLEALDWPMDLTRYTLELVVRQGGRERTLVKEAHRIHELYKLTDSEIQQAFSGVHSTLPEWRADRLEASAYSRLMGCKDVEVLTEAEIEQGLGYNLYSQLYGKTPVTSLLVAGTRQVNLPPAGYGTCLILEYNAQGRLLNSHVKTSPGAIWLTQHPQCRWVDVYGGSLASLTAPMTQYNTHDGVMVSGEEYGHYFCTTLDQAPTYAWQMADPDVDITLSDTAWHWETLPELFYTANRRADRITFYSTSVYAVDHVLEFTVGSYEEIDGVVSFAPMTLPTAKLILWLNRHRLIEGIDYHVQWPRVVIVNKVYLDTTQTLNTVHVLAFGLLGPSMERHVSQERGFVKNGKISVNGQYDIRDGKVYQVVLDGGVLTDSHVTIHPTENQVTVNLPLPDRDYALPYAIERLPIHLPFLTTQDSLSYREAAYDLDKRISAILTAKLPDSLPLTPLAIPERYNVISPFFCRILMDLRQGQLDISDITDHFAMASVPVSQLETRVAPYTYLLDYDPCRLGIEEGYMMIHPHGLPVAMDVTEKEYVLLIRLNHLYLNNRVETHQTLRIIKEENT